MDKIMDLNLVTVREIYRDKEKYIGQEITVGGWIRTVRDYSFQRKLSA